MGRVLDWVLGRDSDLIKRDVEPLEGTNISLFNSIIPSWWDQNVNVSSLWVDTPTLAERVWVANRCQQMNAQQIASMPLEFHGTSEPAWVYNPDPNWFPNGIGDAVHAIVDQLYGWGSAFLLVTDRYADGFPRAWTVLDSSRMNVTAPAGAREYEYATKPLDRRDVVQIDRNPGVRLRGTSALRAYAQMAWGLLAAGNQSLSLAEGGVPLYYLKSQRKLTEEQAKALQAQWMSATQRRNGAPPVIPPEIDPEKLSIDPKDLALLEMREFDARMIATAYGVPSVLLNMALQGGLTYQNPGALGEMWWRFELRTTATRVANAFSAQMLPRGNWVSFRADDTFAPIGAASPEDDPQAAVESAENFPPVASTSPAQRLTAIGGGAG
jgi:HK97 family phage portal protein